MSNHTPSPRPRRTRLALLTLALALALATTALAPAPGLAGSAGCKGARKAPAQLSAGQLRGATICLINRQRARHGLRAVHVNRKLRKAASRHSADMVRRDYFSHFSPGGGSIQSRIGGSGYLRGARSFLYGEVIGGGKARAGSPKRVIKAWMRSGAHRSAILNGSFRHLGVGIAHGYPGRGKRGATFTVDFGTRS